MSLRGTRGQNLVLASLSVVLLCSAVGVAFVQFEARNQFGLLQSLHAERDALQVEWERLLLEQGTWAAPSRVEQLSREKLSMHSPDVGSIKIIRAGVGSFDQ